MKKIVALILMLCLVLSLTGCKSSTEKLSDRLKNIHIQVDQSSVDEATQAIKDVQDALSGQ